MASGFVFTIGSGLQCFEDAVTDLEAQSRSRRLARYDQGAVSKVSTTMIGALMCGPPTRTHSRAATQAVGDDSVVGDSQSVLCTAAEAKAREPGRGPTENLHPRRNRSVVMVMMFLFLGWVIPPEY